MVPCILFHFELVREGHLANEDGVDLSDIFYFAPEAFQPFKFVSTSIQSGGLENIWAGMDVDSHSFSWHLKKNDLPYA